MYSRKCYLGIDVGSVSTNMVAVDEKGNVIEKLYIRTEGQPIIALKKGLSYMDNKLEGIWEVKGNGTTGSGRRLAAVITGADAVKNEITAHASATQKLVPDVRTVLEIGGQDSKIIFIDNGIVRDFAMNTVCAAGTGSFLDRQAARLGLEINELGSLALKSKSPVRIAGRCAVFAESDMIHKQQTGHAMEDIVAGLCEALVRNYLSNLAKGKKISEPVVFQGGVAANKGIAKAFEKALGYKIIIPEYYDVMGAYGAALIAKDTVERSIEGTAFRGFEILKENFYVKSSSCDKCPNECEIVHIMSGVEEIACWGDRCGNYSHNLEASQTL